MDWTTKLGFLLTITGLILLIFSSLKNSKVSFSVVGFIGPIPIGISNDPELLKLTILLAIILLIFFTFTLLWLKQ